NGFWIYPVAGPESDSATKRRLAHDRATALSVGRSLISIKIRAVAWCGQDSRRYLLGCAARDPAWLIARAPEELSGKLFSTFGDFPGDMPEHGRCRGLHRGRTCWSRARRPLAPPVYPAKSDRADLQAGACPGQGRSQ